MNIRYWINLLEANEEDPDATDDPNAERLQRARDMGFDVDDPHYFGTPNGDFDELDLDRTSDENLAYGRGAYTSRDPAAASGYSKPGASWGNHTEEPAPTVYKVYLKVKNPFDLDKHYLYAETKRIFTHCFDADQLQGIEFWTDLATEAEDYEYMPHKEESRYDDDNEEPSELAELESQLDNLDFISDEDLRELSHRDLDPEDYEDGENDSEFIAAREEAIEHERKGIQYRLDQLNKRAADEHENLKKSLATGYRASALGKDIYRTLWHNTDGYHDWESELKLFGGETDTIEFKTEANRWLEELGYDGIRHVDQYNPGAIELKNRKPHVVTIAFHPHQVRSAHAQFDPDKADSPKLSESGISIYGREKVGSELPAASFSIAIKRAFDAHPQVSKFVDLTLTVTNTNEVEITFIATEKQRRKGHGGAVMDLVARAADQFGIVLKLHAYFAKGTGARRVLDQQDLESFYYKRGFRIVDPTNKERWMVRRPKSQNVSETIAYRGVRETGFEMAGGANHFDTTFGLFFASSKHDAEGYAGSSGYHTSDSGKVITVDLDLSAALDWTAQTSKEFQEYVVYCRQKGQSPIGVKSALQQYNQRNDSDYTLNEAIGYLLRESPNRLGWEEIDPLMGYVRGFIKEHGKDVIIRNHDGGGGMISGKEYIVFSPKRIKVIPNGD